MLMLRRELPRRIRGGDDQGFSLIEVLVAIAILGIISLMASRLLIGAISTTTSIDQRQTAVAVATMQMESVRGNDAGPSVKQSPSGLFPGTSALFNGRPKTAQLGQFDTAHNTAAAAVADILANTYPEWDSTLVSDSASAAADVVVPLTDTTVLNGTTYKSTIILGTCFVPTTQEKLAQPVNGTCGKVDGVTAGTAYNSPALPSGITGYAKLVRAIVVVEWSGGTGGCSADAPCNYALTSEFLPSILDLLWEPTS